MEAHLHLTDARFEQQFQTCTLDASIFTHEAHLRLAWIQIRQYGLEKAIYNVCSQLRRYVDHLGASGKYNQTLTVAAVYAVNHFINRSNADNFTDFIQEFPRLKYNFRDLIRTHYSMDIFNYQPAREQYLEPDLLPFT